MKNLFARSRCMAATAVILTLLAPARWTPLHAQQAIGPGQTPDRSVELESALLAKAKEQGWALVVVELALPTGFHAEGELDDARVQAQRVAIAAAADALLAELAGATAQITAHYQTIPYVALRIDADALAKLLASPWVASIQEDRPDLALLTSSTAHVGLPPVWAAGVNGAGQTVVMLDTGVDTDHPFLSGRVVDGACFSDAGGYSSGVSLCPNGQGSQIGTPAAEADTANPACWNGTSSLCGHGTLTAGVALGDDGSGLRGVAPDANLIEIQVFTRFDGSGVCGGPAACAASYLSDQLSALEHVHTTLRYTHAIAAVNMSLGGGLYPDACDADARKALIDNLRSVGIATVIAAGNTTATDAMAAPACISSAVAAGGVSDTDNAPADSIVYSMGQMVDLLAPARSITSSGVGGGYGTASGTSFAAPFVAGAFALCRSVNPALSVDQVESILEQTGVRVADQRSGGMHTKPRLQLDAAIAACQQVNAWTGAANSAWNDPANWSKGTVPTASSFVNVCAGPAGTPAPTISQNVTLRSLMIEPGAQVTISSGALTVSGSLEILGTGRLNAGSGALVLTGAQGARLALPNGTTLPSLQIGDGAANRLVSAESNLAIAGPLVTMPGAALSLGLNTLTSEGVVTNNGALSQMKRVAAGTTRFLRITNQAGAVERYLGVDITAAATMGLTRVTVQGDQPFGAGASGVERCYDVRPATPGLADLTFFYVPEEAPGITAPLAWRANNQTWEGPLPGSSGNAGQAQYVTATGVSSYSLFGLAASNPLAVTLAYFLAEAEADHILLTWQTVTEIDNAGFNLYRSLSPDGERTLLAHVPSQAPGGTGGASYSYQDASVQAGQTHWYWLEAIDLSGGATVFEPVSATIQAPTAVRLGGLSADVEVHATATLWALAAFVLAVGAVVVVIR